MGQSAPLHTSALNISTLPFARFAAAPRDQGEAGR